MKIQSLNLNANENTMAFYYEKEQWVPLPCLGAWAGCHILVRLPSRVGPCLTSPHMEVGATTLPWVPTSLTTLGGPLTVYTRPCRCFDPWKRVPLPGCLFSFPDSGGCLLGGCPGCPFLGGPLLMGTPVGCCQTDYLGGGYFQSCLNWRVCHGSPQTLLPRFRFSPMNTLGRSATPSDCRVEEWEPGSTTPPGCSTWTPSAGLDSFLPYTGCLHALLDCLLGCLDSPPSGA